MAIFTNAERKLPPYYENQLKTQLRLLKQRKEILLSRLEAATTREDKRTIGEELASLPTTIRMM